jgi:hypothetical protein
VIATRQTARKRTAAVWLTLTALSALAVGTVDSPVVFFVALTLWGFAFWMAVPAMLRLLAERSDHPSERMGDAQAAMAAGRVLGPILGGLALAGGQFGRLSLTGAAVISVAAVTVAIVEWHRVTRIPSWGATPTVDLNTDLCGLDRHPYVEPGLQRQGFGSITSHLDGQGQRTGHLEANPISTRFHVSDPGLPTVAGAALGPLQMDGDSGWGDGQQDRAGNPVIGDMDDMIAHVNHSIPCHPSDQIRAGEVGGIVGTGAETYLLGGPGLGYPSALDHVDQVGEQGRLEGVMRDQQPGTLKTGEMVG